MLTKLHYTVPLDLLKEASTVLPADGKHTINEPTGNFFYDPWQIKQEYKGTVWQKILDSLPFPVGEARIITLKYGTCYQSHSDIDDRFHINIASHYAYHVNLESNKLYPLDTDGCWYEFNAGIRHSSVNFGYTDRVQLVVRKLLGRNLLKDSVSIKLFYSGNDQDSVRFVFDDIISPWLNVANRVGMISNFSFNSLQQVEFNIERNAIPILQAILPEHFEIALL